MMNHSMTGAIMQRSAQRFSIIGAALLMAATSLAAQQEQFIPHPMTIQYNVRVPMRDGVTLSVDVYRPKDTAKHPSIFELTPYNNISANTQEQAWKWVTRGYAFVTADARGRNDSDGEFRPYRTDGPDGSDIIDWVAKQSWSNERVATFGGSYLGKDQWEIAKQSNPHHVAMAPYVAPQDDFNDLARYNGVPKLDLMYTWLMGMDGRTAQPSNGWKWSEVMRQLPLVNLDRLAGRDMKFWQDMMAHDSLDDFWMPAQMTGSYEKVKVPSFNVTGWYEGQLRGTVQGYENAVRVTGKPADHKLIIGPWLHGVNNPRNQKIGERDSGPGGFIELEKMRDAWLDHIMLGTPAPNLPNVMYFLPVKNEWRSAEGWPLPSTRFTEYYLDSKGSANTLHGDGVLTEKPGKGKPDAYAYDPANPVPSVTSRTAGARGGLPQGSVDNRKLEERPDVLVYTSAPLKEGVEIAGPVKAKITFSTDVPDTDIAVKLLDVGPDGRALNITEGIARARYRNSYSHPELLEAGKTYTLEVVLFPTANYFEAGHQIRLEVSSNDFPNFGRNLNTGKNNETTTEMRVAHTKILHTKDAMSSITLPVIPTGSAPTVKPVI
jgi:putative CocE/NonD family hydrolase